MLQITKQLTKEHQKKEFSCGKPLLDNYIQKQSTQDMKRRLSVVFVLEEEETKMVKGYYSLSNHTVLTEHLPEGLKKKTPPSYIEVPVTLIGRLAVDKNYQGQGLGEVLLLDALERSYHLSKTQLGSIAVVVDPIDESAINFYQKYGFFPIPDRQRLFLPMGTIQKIIE